MIAFVVITIVVIFTYNYLSEPLVLNCCHGEQYNWKTYTSDQYGFDFQYPALLLEVKESGGVTTLSHSIDYTHPNACDFKDDAPPLKKLSDFGVTIRVVNQGLKKYVDDNTYFGWMMISQNPVSIGPLNGFKIIEGVVGCGKYTYYFELSPNKTLVVDRAMVTEFTSTIANYQTYLNLSGIIQPSLADEFFKNILSTFKVTK